jgi:uncharacterized protein (TIGR02687 family)
MNLLEIRNFLKELFSKPLGEGKVRHIVFWYDESGDFFEDMDTFELEDVKILKLNKKNAFYTKYYIEKEDLNSDLLIYSNMKKPSPQEDWLYDIFCYSEEFSTDRATVIMRELGIKDTLLKGVFKEYNTFFKNKERIAAFKNLNIEDYSEEKIHIGVLSVLTKVKLMSLEEIVKALIKENLDRSNKLYEDVKKFGSVEALWNLIENYYGYSFEEKSLERFMAMLLVTTMNETVKFELPKAYTPFISTKVTNCVVFVNHFMHHGIDSKYYDRMESLTSKKLKITSLLEKRDIDEFINCDVFEEIDLIIFKRITSLLEEDVEEYNKYLNIFNGRRTLHFYRKHESEYEALKWVMNLLNKKKELGSSIKTESAYNMFITYTEEYYSIDKAYRKFYYYFDKCEQKDNLHGLRDKIENIYTNWYLQELSIKWFEALENCNNTWRIDGLRQQDRFYKDFIKYKYKERVFVIVSDALRFECAEELNSLLTNERKGISTLEFMQGAIPSYTKLGMAALLPNTQLKINEKYDVLVDGMSSSGTENRNTILHKEVKNSMAITFEKVMDMKDAEFRSSFAGMDLVYIYHNTIDARGDHAGTEREVFEASEQAFKEIIALVNKLVNRVSASSIVITADHGYLYKRDPMEESDKIHGVKFDDGEDGRRFILTNSAEEIEGTCVFSMDYLLGNESSKYVITPRGTSRFKIQGAGANYVHGGAMLQEVVIPVIRFKNDRSTSSANEVRKARVSLTSVSRKITNIITYLEFFQEEKIQDKVIPRRIKCYFEDEEGNRISNENIVIGDSKSENPLERTFREKFVLKSMNYNKKKQYFFVIQDDEDANALYERIAFTIDIAILDDFGF